ncbi:putative PurR-regulated permease PerM [Rhodopirellula rubra]|uniref:Putative PurR-regulated permease PerM n=1 Tax=Aporhodopirellula rubra TaxID=980271 RepID=A0A7W5DXT2_9BACT|nr:AI-2E family transporter [Aporhodopirellula rubra]MBB3206157.1 putative PurR-regulated permease PerM [Aporhodopirellula rubra]
MATTRDRPARMSNGRRQSGFAADSLRVHGPHWTRRDSTSPWVVCIAFVLILGVLYVASSLFVPLAVSLIAYLTLRPLVARLCRLGLNQVTATAVVILVFFSIAALVTSLLYSPLQSWLAEAPESVNRLREKFDRVAEPLATVDRAEEQLSQATEGVRNEPTEVTVSVKKPSVIDPAYLINQTGHLLAFVGAIGVLTFFMLTNGDDVLNRILNVLPRGGRRESVLETIAEIQNSVGTYLGQITIINAGLGVAVTIVMWAVGMPTPYLWGAMAALFNFVPYLGPIAGTLVVLVAAGTTFDSFGRSLLTAAAFWVTTAVEGQFVTPAILGTTLKVGSLIVLVSVAFWGFMWGMAGVLLSVPLLIVMRQVFASFDETYAIAVVLGEDPCRPGDDCEPLKQDEAIAESV